MIEEKTDAQSFEQWASTYKRGKPTKGHCHDTKEGSPFYWQDLVVDLLKTAKKKGKVVISHIDSIELLGIHEKYVMPYSEMLDCYDSMLVIADKKDQETIKNRKPQNNQEA